jgi:hypothetical protein
VAFLLFIASLLQLVAIKPMQFGGAYAEMH